MGTYTLKTNTDQDTAIAQELKVYNGKRLEQMQPEATAEEFVQEFFSQQLNPARQKWKQSAVARIVQALQANPDIAPKVEAAIAAAGSGKAG